VSGRVIRHLTSDSVEPTQRVPVDVVPSSWKLSASRPLAETILNFAFG
jgi:hypothetical protein